MNDSAYGAELHRYASKGLHDDAMHIREIDFYQLAQVLGAKGTKATKISHLEALRCWLDSGEDGVFVLDVAISIVVEYMAEAIASF